MKRKILLLLYAVALISIWQGAVLALKVPRYIIPAPTEVAGEFIANPTLLIASAWVTLYEAVCGFVIGASVGITLALLLAYSPLAESLIMPTVLALQSLPKVAIAPVLIVWFGLGFPSKLVLVSTTVFFPVLLSTLAGLTGVEADMIDLIRGMNGTKFQVFRKVRIPCSVPFIFNGMKIAVPFAMIGAIVAEFISSERGLGNLILLSSQNMRTALNFASLVVIALLSSLLYQVVLLAERFVLRLVPSAPRS